MTERIAVVGLGYAGLPVAVALARKFPGTIGFDINEGRVEALTRGTDSTGEVSSGELAESNLELTSDEARLREATFFIVAVPTPIDDNHRPNLAPVEAASRTVGRALAKGSVVVYESTVYPGVTEGICARTLENESGLRAGRDFKLGYSPERINPGDREHRFESIIKVVAAQGPEALERVAAVYESVVDAGIHRAPSIKVAEAAKVIENIQRDLNIALMNELALVFDRVGIRTHDVLQAAKTKWNFLGFEPGLVGGHCIGVDPYYLTTLADELGYHPQVILAGRRINESMGEFIAQRLVKLLSKQERALKDCRVGVLGMSFKPNVADLRNSKVPNIARELREYGVEPMVHDPLVDPEEALRSYGLRLLPWDELDELDALVLAVPHRQFLELSQDELLRPLGSGGVLMDVKSVLSPGSLPSAVTYWSL